MERKIIDIVPYDPNWPNFFEMQAKEIASVLGENVIQIHHIGSTSVPGLCAKPKIDIMCVVKDLKIVSKTLESVGFKDRGEFRHLPLRLFFSKHGNPDINLHIVKENNGEIERSLCFRDYLRKNEEARDLYGNTKLKLLKENKDGFEMVQNQIFSNYANQKTSVIMKILKMTNYNGYRLIEALEENEISAFKKLMNLEKISFDNPDIFHLCLYKGIGLVAAVLIEFYENSSKAKIEKINAVDVESKKVMIEKIEEWLEFKGTTLEN